MKVIKSNSKKGHYYLKLFESSYINGCLPHLSQVYGKYSLAKMYAYSECSALAFKYAKKISDNIESNYYWKVVDMGVISYNWATFTFGALLYKVDQLGHYHGALHMVITKENIYII